MRRFRKYIIMTLVVSGVYLSKNTLFSYNEQIIKNESFAIEKQNWDELVVRHANGEQIGLVVNGKEIDTDQVFMQKNRELMIPASILGETFNCAVHLYNGTKLVLERYQTTVEFVKDTTDYYVNGEQKATALPMVKIEKEYYLPLNEAAKSLGYDFTWNIEENNAVLINENLGEQVVPYKYDLRDMERAPFIKNQGAFGTCWAVAAITAVESSLMPEENLILAPDHMNYKNSFLNYSDEGGEYAMAVAYLTAWQGPVLEEDDPYGDEISPENLKPVKHVQEARFIESKDYKRIKEMVYKYGGVESSIYSSIKSNTYRSIYFNRENSAYCYIGEEKPNHEIVIIGWDDSFSKENFNMEVEGDGAFICQNSWGEEFGEDGIFYVSYYDTNIGIYNVAYTGVEESDNYDNIYQTDLCGWVGQLGYDREEAFFANVYTAKRDEALKAVGFYALGKDTEYKIYVVEEFENKDSLNKRKLIKTGYFEDAGYYTVELPEALEMPVGTEYAVIIEIFTPSSIHPVAIEFQAGATTKNADITDGEGYISLSGTTWENVEEKQNCNLCLKVYTNNN